ncbi:head-tail adaptor Ad1 [Rhodococcus phage PhailMary]|uniref:Head-to-tail adaptor n=4 Tax=Rerduovirus TaxID=1982375 RepID=A0A222ZI18_9CAUD|nr:head-tail adaptor Ad1 [Rhodococcus phage Hiro]YP_010060226.1 head-tail adaptor Ad1 [Rhodococcus phage PhailMary]ASR84394.1 head-to-tail adaptor [Rhodococcus phage Krishelle]AST15178.1 head-to-tail adaptor [Rhodococcus phage AppleCloud]ASR84198.1 head-to-tail adaptor [Rhodococcus phage Hiro]QPL15171.1 head-to-tail adaptor [Rhodococcus phage PhailMary]
MTYATVEDVAVRFARELTEEESALVLARLTDAENRIRSRIPDLDDQVVAGTILEANVVQVCSDAVLRLVRNPDGFVQETDGNYTYMLSQDAARGNLTILRDEWEILGVRRKVFMIHQSFNLPGSRT